eukprot:TRINITY_DN12112_c0_g1_i1.p1 TRINITY_DN12112_c0_g1~~TRINITY_DN12112_c0_g1_i1.p1  ORF type:complete len:188 (-),score=36.86 TRINITY_DN12112_c0_g1_i1:44-607(-)
MEYQDSKPSSYQQSPNMQPSNIPLLWDPSDYQQWYDINSQFPLLLDPPEDQPLKKEDFPQLFSQLADLPAFGPTFTTEHLAAPIDLENPFRNDTPRKEAPSRRPRTRGKKHEKKHMSKAQKLQSLNLLIQTDPSAVCTDGKHLYINLRDPQVQKILGGVLRQAQFSLRKLGYSQVERRDQYHVYKLP